MRKLVLLATAAFALALAGPLLAQPTPTLTVDAPGAEPDRAWERVSFADLDLANEAGAMVLRHRVQAAARRVCQGVEGIRYDGSKPVRWGRCWRETFAAAMPQVDGAIARARTGEAFAAAVVVQPPSR